MPCPKWEETVVPLAMGVSLALRADLPAMANQIRAFGLRQINPTGKSLRIFRNRVKPRNQKYPAFALGQISARTSAIPCPQEGRFAIVTDVGCGMRWTRQRQARANASRTNDAEAYGQVVSF